MGGCVIVIVLLEVCHGSQGSGERVPLGGDVAGDVVGGEVEGVEDDAQRQLVQGACGQTD